MDKTITKEFNFCYAHRLENTKITDKENVEVFGKCFLDTHGHNAKMLITVSGPEKNGMIINFTNLKKIVNENIIDIFDHRNLNEMFTFKNKIPTCENIVEVFWKLLEWPLWELGVTLKKIKLYETDTSYVELKK